MVEELRQRSPRVQAALVAAGLLSVVLFPLAALAVLRASERKLGGLPVPERA